MNIKYENGEIKFQLEDILGYVSSEQKLALVEHLSCHDEVIKHVTDQIIDEWTENGCHGGVNFAAKAEPKEYDALDTAWRRVAKASNDIAKDEIERLEKALLRNESEIVRLNETIRSLPRY